MIDLKRLEWDAYGPLRDKRGKSDKQPMDYPRFIC